MAKKKLRPVWGEHQFRHTITESPSLNQHELLRLIDRYLEGKASEQEKDRLNNIYDNSQQEQEWNEKTLGSRDTTEQRILHRLLKAVRRQPVMIPFFKRRWFHVAAAVVLLAGSSVVWFFQPAKTVSVSQKTALLPPHPEGTKGASLQLLDGELVWLNAAADGRLAEKGGVAIYKKGRVLMIRPTRALPVDPSMLSATCILITPGGSQYEVILADSTHVWVNAATNLRFPPLFSGSERKVEVYGEAYFEVAKQAGKPFRVFASGASGAGKKGVLVEVLGTRFNINAYHDEALLKTTLVEGLVKITATEGTQSDSSSSAFLSPGQQAQFSPSSRGEKTIAVQAADVGEALAWKKNEFSFRAADIPAIMRQLMRWYNVQVVYEGRIPARTFTGTISRSTPLPTVLEILEQSDIHFRVKGQTIVVKP